MSKKEAKTSVGSYCSRCVTVSTDWQFLAVSESFLGFLGSKNHVDPIFFMRQFTKKNFSSKFQFSAKAMMTPPGDQTVTKNFWLVVNSEIFKSIKNMFGLCGHFFLELRTCSSQQWYVLKIFGPREDPWTMLILSNQLSWITTFLVEVLSMILLMIE